MTTSRQLLSPRFLELPLVFAALLGATALGCVEVEGLDDDFAGDTGESDGGDDGDDPDYAQLPDIPEEPEGPGVLDPEEPADPQDPADPEEPEPEEPEPEPEPLQFCGNHVVDPGEQCDDPHGVYACASGVGLAFCDADCSVNSNYCECPVGSHDCPCATDGSCDEGFACDLSPDQAIPICRPSAPVCADAGDSCTSDEHCCGDLRCSAPAVGGVGFCA